MPTFTDKLTCGMIAFFAAIFVSFGQANSPAPDSNSDQQTAAKGLFMDQIEHVYYIKTAAEKTAEPTESDNYQFSYSRAKDVAPLLASQLSSKEAPQFDERTNTIFFRETRSNIDSVRKLLVTIDKPTKQVMIEARLVEVTANPKQSYGINWAGVVGSSSSPQTFSYGAPRRTGGP